MNRRNFIRSIAIAGAAAIFVPKLIKPVWKRTAQQDPMFAYRVIKGMEPHILKSETFEVWLPKNFRLEDIPIVGWRKDDIERVMLSN